VIDAPTVILPSVSFLLSNDPATPETYTLSLHDALPISHHRIGAYNPDRLKLSLFQRGDHLSSSKSRLIGNSPNAPKLRHFLTMGCIGDGSMRSKGCSQATHFTAAHSVRLAREGEGSGARLTDVACQKVEAGQRQVLLRPNRTLTEAHSAHRQKAPRSADPGCSGPNVFYGHAADLWGLGQ